LPLPKLVEGQVEWVKRQVAQYISEQHKTYRGRAKPLDRNQMVAVHPFFPASTLDSARILVLSGERIGNPPFYRELLLMGFEPGILPEFTDMAAITFVDTVVSHEPFTDRLLFHELVHVVQYQKLGLENFAVKYLTGFLEGGSYEAIPVELNAYELDARFAATPTRAFSVADEVQAWINAGRF
jgi:hypothetical protein